MRLSKLTIFLLTFAVAVFLPLTIRGQANKANGPSNYALIGPGGGTDPGTPPTCNPDLEPCYCDPEFSPGEQLRCYEPVTPPPPDPPPTCAVAMYYRPIAYVGYVAGVNHSWWFTTDANYDPWVMDAFPTVSCSFPYVSSCGYLNAYETYGTAGEGDDNFASGTFYWSYPAHGKNVSACQMSYKLQAFTQAWRQNTIAYYILGPNSNTFASRAAAYAGIAVPTPPAGLTPGWGQ